MEHPKYYIVIDNDDNKSVHISKVNCQSPKSLVMIQLQNRKDFLYLMTIKLKIPKVKICVYKQSDVTTLLYKITNAVFIGNQMDLFKNEEVYDFIIQGDNFDDYVKDLIAEEARSLGII